MKQPDTTLAKADTVALWHAVQWMEACLSEWRREGLKEEADRAKHDAQREMLRLAKRALRKVNAIRRAQGAGAAKTCRSTEKPQVERKTAGAAGAQPRNHRVSRAQEQRETAGGAGA